MSSPQANWTLLKRTSWSGFVYTVRRSLHRLDDDVTGRLVLATKSS